DDRNQCSSRRRAACSCLGHLDCELGTVGFGKIGFLDERLRHRAVADLVRVAERVEAKQLRRQCGAARMALAAIAIDLDLDGQGAPPWSCCVSRGLCPACPARLAEKTKISRENWGWENSSGPSGSNQRSGRGWLGRRQTAAPIGSNRQQARRRAQAAWPEETQASVPSWRRRACRPSKTHPPHQVQTRIRLDAGSRVRGTSAYLAGRVPV